MVEQHTVVGRADPRAGRVPGRRAAAGAHAHERWDGSGYPDGLAGEEIPLGARIIFACDTYDAMTTDRPYREALPHAEALAELRRVAGTQFDRAVVEALIASPRASCLLHSGRCGESSSSARRARSARRPSRWSSASPSSRSSGSRPRSNAELLLEQARRFGVERIALADAARPPSRRGVDRGEVLAGPRAWSS